MRRARARRRRTAWDALVPVVALAAGMLFATSGQTARGTDLRAGDVTELSQLIRQLTADNDAQEAQLGQLQDRSEALTAAEAGRNGAVAAAAAAGAAEEASAGFTAVSGAGLEVTLDDAPETDSGTLPRGANVDDLVIHQSDVQGVVNALWAAGADGVAIMGQRLIATSAVRCVGNVLLLQGRTYSPPFVVTAVGDADAMRDRLGESREVAALQQAVDRFGLTYRVQDSSQVDLPAYDGALDLQYASAAG
ncbi:Uncharacterized conserved protein YlxW, UPF0749 family [Klenkia soli]|uniref:Uncharacterized conserved protein YlxW, UPF0749 family n=1 Tax=Klenkia soli TaxID=1052260 RepID=A0A1H0RAR7_9ACTN|nr:DUF881 domain-containing protein [Klenkia soli]SDP26048.1 Uncharacterized conserved protein YlxW, UPF0749 family [Klenkia soli]